ncbi:hypothetical protein MUO14_01870 [Halobacillus shinanisalinarum]|uniref:YaiI/YqxD family protein n=1 Tax=Halobacillus shinanisalinarum TaxID=2932258 RepID=A0ABY4H0R5_9BACI|nr:hypothetical protein [Halobacillus shinanisalinarum]UOQ93765.1 hypothetical protein MUO14_01870 [Halobacillus shinanisalinarum]
MLKQKPHVWVDADCCPVQEEIVHVCKQVSVTPTFIATINRYKTDQTGEDWIFLDHGSQAVDLYIINAAGEK